MTGAILNFVFGQRLHRETSRYLNGLTSSRTRASDAAARRLLDDLDAAPGQKISLGTTGAGGIVSVPSREIAKAHGIVTGGSGSGKTRFGLLLLQSFVNSDPQTAGGFGVLDAKGELFQGALALLGERLTELDQTDPDAARDLRNRIVVIDFASRNLLSPYNILVRPKGTDPDFFAGSRADLLLDLLASDEAISLSASSLLRRIILLLSEFDLPITWAGDLIHDADLRGQLLSQSQQQEVAAYFRQQFPDLPKQTLGALVRRLEALCSSESVRLALAGTGAPDFRAYQDEGRIVLVNCFGEGINRSVRRLLQGLVLSDITQAVFARKRKEEPFLWFCDEAQTFFGTPQLRDHMTDLLTMARSFGSFFAFFTQNLSTAVHDPKMRSILNTNVRWSFSMRGEPSDCEFLRPALPVTGTKFQPNIDPFQEPRRYSLNEERSLEHEGLAHLPDRTGFLWLRTRSGEALKIKTATCPLPDGDALEAMTQSVRSDPTVGERIAREEHDRVIEERDRKWRATAPAVERAPAEFDLAAQYERRRGSLS